MNAFLSFLIRFVAAGFTTFLTWIFSFFIFDRSFFESFFYSLIGGTAVFFGLKYYIRHRFIKMTGLTRSEYKLVQRNLKDAKQKIQRLQKALFNISNIRDFINAKHNIETIRVVKKIYSVTKKEPVRFFKAEEFYYKHLDSMVEIAEKYSFLSSQPVKTKELNQSLQETRQTLTQLSNVIKEDLYNMLEGDLDSLQFELDVARQSINQKKIDDGRFQK
ncbi:5-bromo-4-chloroindolyl phosphate hydrolysis family protein [Fervidibacillus halotolerans]|uniref:5-bromo-4-chloroindolyl phosphate hydrolysis family protein n=1 Tax=Fervidibacillus halotolerans TaxID=2980027 RepID=A0A9E8M031_9BACI|nr:5-bromo-4-chloroindolyl phosphate hydrolysis family protein [Fervidibacillus halotolerans]WAA12547.1 5-bromo-4-chloroindolyl phosphate hydrolysis family protein [Fervidibacillus halotolerans]